MARNQFIDPNGVLPTYQWDIGFDTEQDGGRDLGVSSTANVANTRVIVQQGDMAPITFNYSGSILRRSQVVAMWQWFNLCRDQTILFTDFAGDEYEVVITSFKPLRRAGVNPRDPAGAPLWYWTYTLTMTVVGIISGPMAEAGVTP